ncbi:hypothetical protein L2E82_02649 [Cichorium intybus]|uniref:Uncharacterized protein n=1 Tax=Cichorium intybus TaxID=13427 RepID=A0ACB9H3V2_CICIN|nr:hypothetical protein L2E82_02649 [Cichorium intybus]
MSTTHEEMRVNSNPQNNQNNFSDPFYLVMTRGGTTMVPIVARATTQTYGNRVDLVHFSQNFCSYSWDGVCFAIGILGVVLLATGSRVSMALIGLRFNVLNHKGGAVYS